MFFKMAKRLYSSEEIRYKYNAHAKWYDFSIGIVDVFASNKRKRLVQRARGRVLDVGAGTGENFYYYPRSCEITAIDLSEKMLERAKRKALKLGRDIEFYIGDTEHLPFPDESFDSVVDSLCLCTYNNPIRALREMRRVCKPNGQILLFEHGISNNRLVNRYLHWREEPHYKSLGCALIRNPEDLAREAGLKIESVERHFFGIFYLITAKP